MMKRYSSMSMSVRNGAYVGGITYRPLAEAVEYPRYGMAHDEPENTASDCKYANGNHVRAVGEQQNCARQNRRDPRTGFADEMSNTGYAGNTVHDIHRGS